MEIPENINMISPEAKNLLVADQNKQKKLGQVVGLL